MAQPLQISVLSTRRIGIAFNGIQRRPFSRISPLYAVSRLTSAQARQQPQAKMNVQNKEAERQLYKTRDDFGILPETFIMPTGPNRPPIYHRDYYKLLWIRYFRHIRDFLGVLYFKWWSIKPRPEIRFRATKAAAIGLHRQMYAAFATGSQSTIKEICAEGICEKMLTRIQNRKRGETFRWEIVKEGRARVVSHRAAPLPVANAGMRQAVVRITSTQKLTRLDKDGKVLAGTGNPRKMTEYVVIQKKSWDGKDQVWKIWGTTSETTLMQIEKQKAEDMANYA